MKPTTRRIELKSGNRIVATKTEVKDKPYCRLTYSLEGPSKEKD